ncbi:MAG TPA: hypothetical protein VMU89_07180 [Thermomicrobiaceae bacterium]|nr:hypothetical protein [Thermomicrobiaceae bacterium]
MPAEPIEQIEDAHVVIAQSVCETSRRQPRADGTLRTVLGEVGVEPAVADLP